MYKNKTDSAFSTTKHLFWRYTRRKKKVKTIDSIFPKTNSSQVQGQSPISCYLLMAIFSGFCGETWLDHWTLSNIARHHPWGKV